MNYSDYGRGSIELISVLIVTYNSRDLLHESIGPIYACPEIEIIVVDNKSSDGTPDFLRQYYPRVRLIENSTNAGFGKAMNLASRNAAGDVFILLNPDANIGASDLVELANRSYRNYEVSAPTISQPRGRLSIHSAGRFPTIWRMFTHYSGLSRWASSVPAVEGHYLLPHPHEPVAIATDWVTGAVLAIPAALWSKVGGISERWFMYAEDIDLCWKVHFVGRSVRLYTDLKAFHLVGESDSTQTYSANPSWIINLLDFYRLRINGDAGFARIWAFVVAAGLASRSLAYRFKHRVVKGEASYMWKMESRKFGEYATRMFQTCWALPEFSEVPND